MVSACSASVSPLPRLPFLSSVGKTSTAVAVHACVGSKHVLETFHNSFGSTEFVLPCEDTVLGGDAQFGASEQKGDVTTMGACGHVEDSNCSADLESESIQDSLFPGIPMMRVQSENPVATEQTESGIRTEFADLEQITYVHKGKVEVSEEVLSADQSESGMSKRLEDSNSPEHMALKGSEELTGLVNVTGSTALTRDDVEQLDRPVIGEKGKECGPLGLYDSNDSVFEDEEGGELCVSNKCEGIVKDSKKGFPAPCCAECVDYSYNESRAMLVPLRSSSNDSSDIPFNGSNETSMPVTVVSDFKDLSLHPASGSRSSPMPPHATDSEDVANLTLLVMDCERALDSESRRVYVSDLTGTLDKGVSATHPANEYSTVDNLASHHLTTVLAPCHFMNEGDILESFSDSEDMSSCPVYKDTIDDNMLVLHAAETKSGGSEDISAPILTNSTNSSACVLLPNLADWKQKSPMMLLGVATDLADKDGRIPVTASVTSDTTDRGCKTPVMPPAPSDVTTVGCSNGSWEIDSSPTKTLSCLEQISDSSALESDKLGRSSSLCDSIVFNNNCSSGSAGNQDYVRSKVGALLAKYGRNVDYEKSPDGRNALTEEKNSLILNGSKPNGEHTQLSDSYQHSFASCPSAALLKDKDSDMHRYNFERRDDLRNKDDITALVDSAVLVNNINNSNGSNPIFDESLFDLKDGYDFLGKFNDCRTNSAGHITSSKQSWHQVSLPKEENRLDLYGNSDGFSHEKCNNFFLDDLEWDVGELDGLNRLDDFGTGDVESYDDMTFGLYSSETSESHLTDLTALRDMLSTCLSHSSAATGSPPHSPSELDNAVVFDQPSVAISNGRGFPSRQKFRRTLANRKFGNREITIASNEDDDDDNESLLSAISEHTEPEYLSD